MQDDCCSTFTTSLHTCLLVPSLYPSHVCVYMSVTGGSADHQISYEKETSMINVKCDGSKARSSAYLCICIAHTKLLSVVLRGPASYITHHCRHLILIGL